MSRMTLVVPDFFVIFRIGLVAVNCGLIAWWIYDVVKTYRELPDWMKKRLWAVKFSRFIPELSIIFCLLVILAALLCLQWEYF